jgi:hypothetical protein
MEQIQLYFVPAHGLGPPVQKFQANRAASCSAMNLATDESSVIIVLIDIQPICGVVFYSLVLLDIGLPIVTVNSKLQISSTDQPFNVLFYFRYVQLVFINGTYAFVLLMEPILLLQWTQSPRIQVRI